MQGWECPKCGKVYAPWVASCTACAVAPGPVPSTPRFPPSPNPTAPWPRRYGTGDFPEFDPKITCDARAPMGLIEFRSEDQAILGTIANLG